MLIGTHNKNETPQHYELKQIAKYLLWSFGYKHIATEVNACWGADMDFLQGCWTKDIIDTIGAKTRAWHHGKTEAIKIMGIEAKASLSDYRNGFCTACEYTYIIAPAGTIPVSALPEKIGLVEVDLQNYQIGKLGGKIWYTGITIAKRARSRLARRFMDKDARDTWALEQFRSIAYRSTVESIFNNSRIEFTQKTIPKYEEDTTECES